MATALHFLARNADGSVRLVVRRSGPSIELLTPDGWVARPQLLPRFWDAGFLEVTTLAEARAAAAANALAWAA